MNDASFSDIERDLGKLSQAVLEECQRVKPILSSMFSEEELGIWAKEGLTIGNQTVRSWEAAVEYFRATLDVSKVLAFPSFMQWARCGTYLVQESPTLAASFFKASPGIVSNLRPQYISRWAGLGRSLYKGTWKSSTVAARFFQVSPGLIKNLPFWDVEIFASLIEALSQKSYDVATECLVLGQEVLSKMGREREAFLSLTRALADESWREVKSCLEVAPKTLLTIEESQRDRFIRLAERLARMGQRNTAGFLTTGSQALNRVHPSAQGYVFDLCEGLLTVSPEAVPAFLGSLNAVLSKISVAQLDTWFQQGVGLLKENPEGGLAYFKVESSTSEQLIETLSSSLELDRVRGILRLYCCALTGMSIDILNTEELVQRGIGWVSEGSSATEGTKVFLPSVADHYSDKVQNFGWFKVVGTHQVAHLEFDSFDFSFERPSVQFKDLRPGWDLEREARLRAEVEVSDGEVTAEESWNTDIGLYFNLFDDKRLALDIFTVLEDGRLDYRVKQEYRGIVPSYKRVQLEALDQRPNIEGLPLREAMVELLMNFSLEQFMGLKVPTSRQAEAQVLAKILRRLLNVAATVEDTAEAAIRAYQIISRLPNEQPPPEEWESQDFGEQAEFSDEELEELLRQMDEQSGQGQQDEQPYESSQQVDYRGDFKPELVQLLNRLRGDRSQQDTQAQPLSKEMLEQLLRESAELEFDSDSELDADSMTTFAQNIMREAGASSASPPPGQGYGPMGHEDEQGGALEAREPRTYVYDEWDFRAGDYKPKWCIVREKVVEEGEPQFFNDTLFNHANLIADIRRQFELIMPENFRKVRRLIDGEDLDLDASIEAIIDRRSGVTPSEKVYWRKNKIQRDVAVVFLLDMSASTAEAIDEVRHTSDDQDTPDDPVEYMMWLRNRREGLVRRHYKRIIDLEKESTVLLIQALETIGDTYGIYGFSGYGRENVEFYVIKDVDERFDERIKRRIDKISPLHATRMGPAIRHANSKLEQQDAKTKILFLLSDGRPQDRGYSREGVEKEYAVHDTHAALLEARRKSIIPFCLTVDKAGHDYLKTMCGDMSYEVLADIWSLPQRLPMLYKKLTI